ncbi:MAG: multifunctional CCA addition/repair protein [Rhodocyclaceae bacterium]|nr:multifunctional CCA addition/repair protein [Rhodocyclaceae bacterium]
MRIYCVGGAVRDELLGRPVEDRDWVVVGATPEEMLARGFKPVGKDFPVFLHPETHEEYALARTERKHGRGYHGFTFHASPEVTLEEDLARRDLTINAMAKDEAGRLIDPYGGRRDLEQKRLRHVSPAFAEDPVRILRLARFAARYPDFTVAEETLALARQMVACGEVDALVPERVWQELSRGLMEEKPSRMFATLRACGALVKLLPELERLFGVPQRADFHPEVDSGLHVMLVIDMAARLKLSLPARFAALTHDLGKGTTPAELLPRHHGHEARSVELVEALCARLKVPAECRDLARLVARFHGDVHKAAELRPATRLAILEYCDALRRPARFAEMLSACEADWRGRLGHEEAAYPQARLWQATLAAVQAVDAAAIARACADPAQIPQRIRAARLAAISSIV